MPKGQGSNQPGAVHSAAVAWAIGALAGLVLGATNVPAYAADTLVADNPLAAAADVLSHPIRLAVTVLVGVGVLAALKRRIATGQPIAAAAVARPVARLTPRAEPRVVSLPGESIADVLAATPAVLRPARPVLRALSAEFQDDEVAETRQPPKPRRRHDAAGPQERPVDRDEEPRAAGATSARALLIQAVALSEDVLAGPAALDFARRLARGGRVIFIDIEGETLDPGPGLAELIGGAVTFADAIGRDDNSRLHLIGRGEDPLEEGGSFELMVDALRETYDFVVLAGEAADDGTVLAAIEEADGAILVRGPETSDSRVRAESEDLRAAGVRDVYVVEADEEATLEAA